MGPIIPLDGEKSIFWASMSDTIPPGESRTTAVDFFPESVRRFNGQLTVSGDQTGGTNVIAVVGNGTFNPASMFTLSSGCRAPAKAGSYLGLACWVWVTLNGTTEKNVSVTADLRGLGLSQNYSLGRCVACGTPPEYDLDLHIPSGLGGTTIPITFTATDVGGRSATTTSNLVIVP